MTFDELVAYCLAKPGAEETYPFGESTLVAKVGGKAFAYLGLADQVVAVRCGRDFDEASPWRARYPDAITPMGYLARHGWNSVVVAHLPNDDLHDLVDTSYADVVSRLPRRLRP